MGASRLIMDKEKHLISSLDNLISSLDLNVNDDDDKKQQEIAPKVIKDNKPNADDEKEASSKYQNTALFYHLDCLKHQPQYGSHVECPERCSTSFQFLGDFGILPHLKQISPKKASKKELKQTHSNDHVCKIVGIEGKHGSFDSDTFYNEHSSNAAFFAAGATIQLLTGILRNDYDNGFALVRPPGHHCEHDKAMGFCLLNNAVIAVNNILNNELCKRVLIIDWDVHHGNGTQNMFYNNDNVLYFSTHRFDNGHFYPGTGSASETGNGFNVNVPLNVGSDVPFNEGHGDSEYLLIWKDLLLPICREFKPEIVLISAGFDACIGDPLGRMLITPPCYGLLTRLLLNECSNVDIVLEGGYNLDTMPRAVCCCHYALLKGPYQQKNNFDVNEFEQEFLANIEQKEKFNEWKKSYGKLLRGGANKSTMKSCKQSIKKVLEMHQKYWKCAAEILKKY